MGYLQMGCVQLQRSVSCSDSRCLKLVREISLQLQIGSSHWQQSWKERRPKEVLALGITSEIYLLERVLHTHTLGGVLLW